jgi:hypothetical protein
MSSGGWLRRMLVFSTLLVFAGCSAGPPRAPKTKAEFKLVLNVDVAFAPGEFRPEELCKIYSNILIQ